MISIYDSTERLFNHNGNKIVHPYKAEITKKDNGDYYAEIEDTIENAAYYQQGAIIRIPSVWGVQAFRVTNPTINGSKVEFTAWHISYDAKQYIVKTGRTVNRNCNDALDYFNGRTDIPSPFTTSSDILTEASTNATRHTLFELFGTLAERYNGHWVRDNYNFSIMQKVGQDNGVVLQVGKNISSLKSTENWENVCTKILPFTVDNETNAVIELDEAYIEITETLYDLPYTKVVQFENAHDKMTYASEEEYLEAVKTSLRMQARAYLEENKLPKVNYSVSANIDKVSDIGDTIQVKHPKCRINITTEVIGIQYDAIRNRYSKIEFGNFRNELKNLSQTITAEANKHTDAVVKETESSLTRQLSQATAKINGVLGNSFVVYEGDKILVVDALPKETAKNVLKISNGGIGFSNTGINGTFTSAWTLDGTLNMQAINVLNLSASLIKGGTLRLGGTDNTNGIFELCDINNNIIARMNNDGVTVYAKNGDYVVLNAEDGFVGYDANGAKIYWADGETFHMKNAEVENQITLAQKIKIVPVDMEDNIGIGFVALG